MKAGDAQMLRKVSLNTPARLLCAAAVLALGDFATLAKNTQGADSQLSAGRPRTAPPAFGSLRGAYRDIRAHDEVTKSL